MQKKYDYLIFSLPMLISEIAKQYTLTRHYGHYVWWNFPFQLCSIPMYLCLLIFLLPECRIRNSMFTFLMTFGLMGGICAFFDTSGMHYPVFFLTLHSYLWHILLIIIGIYSGIQLLKTKKNVPDRNPFSFCGAVSIYGVSCVIAEVFNLCFEEMGEINLFYINPHHAMSQIVFDKIAEKTSTTCSIILYICCSVFGAYLLFFCWKLIFRKFSEHHF